VYKVARWCELGPTDQYTQHICITSSPDASSFAFGYEALCPGLQFFDRVLPLEVAALPLVACRLLCTFMLSFGVSHICNVSKGETAALLASQRNLHKTLCMNCSFGIIASRSRRIICIYRNIEIPEAPERDRGIYQITLQTCAFTIPSIEVFWRRIEKGHMVDDRKIHISSKFDAGNIEVLSRTHMHVATFPLFSNTRHITTTRCTKHFFH